MIGEPAEPPEAFARQAHAGQLYGTAPYMTHLEQAVALFRD